MMGRCTNRVIAVTAMLCLLFVLVTPLVAAPLSLTHGKRICDGSHLALVPSCAEVTRQEAVFLRPETAPAITLSGVDVICLTCARIC